MTLIDTAKDIEARLEERGAVERWGRAGVLGLAVVLAATAPLIPIPAAQAAMGVGGVLLQAVEPLFKSGKIDAAVTSIGQKLQGLHAHDPKTAAKVIASEKDASASASQIIDAIARSNGDIFTVQTDAAKMNILDVAISNMSSKFVAENGGQNFVRGFTQDGGSATFLTTGGAEQTLSGATFRGNSGGVVTISDNPDVTVKLGSGGIVKFNG